MKLKWQIREIKKVPAQKFKLKSFGPLRYFLGIEVARSSKGVAASQRKYTLDLPKEVGMLAC